jgi:hypothetical protein
MTDKEKYDFLKKQHPKATDAELRAAVKEFQVLEGGLAGASIAKALLNFGKSVFTKKTAAKAAEEAAKKSKMSLKKKAAIAAGVLTVGQAGSMLMNNKSDETDANASGVEAQLESELANAIATADATGADVTQLLSGETAQQLGIGINNVSELMAKYGSTTPLVGLNGVGIFTGQEIDGGQYVGSMFVPEKKSEIVSLSNWNKSFPVDEKGIAAAKQKFIDAGVLDPTADLIKVKSEWDRYGQLSLDYSRAGNKISPWQLLDIQKGLTGSGSQTSTTIDVSPMAESDIRTTAKRQLAQSLGLANVDDKMYKDILAIVRKKEAKNPSKKTVTTTGNKTIQKTVTGYGISDVLADVEEYAKKDPRYAEFQTSDVFGNALIKSLGLKS